MGITAVNDGSATDDLIASMRLDQNPANLGSIWTRETLRVLTGGGSAHLILVLEWKVECLPNYLDDCLNYCVSTNDSSGHYTCDPLGCKLCHNGYEDPKTNCIKRILIRSTIVCTQCNNLLQKLTNVHLIRAKTVPRALTDFSVTTAIVLQVSLDFSVK